MTNLPGERGLILPVSERHLSKAVRQTDLNELGRTLTFGKRQGELAAQIGDLFMHEGIRPDSVKGHLLTQAVRRCFVVSYDALTASWHSETGQPVQDFPTVIKSTVDGYLPDPSRTVEDQLAEWQPLVYDYAEGVFDGLAIEHATLPVGACLGSLATMYGLMEQQLNTERPQLQ
jgi:hypothetical protein